MRVLLTSAGLETKEIQDCFEDIMNINMDSVKALFIPTAAIFAAAIEVLPECMKDLLKCGIKDKNIKVFDLHRGMDIEELQQYDVVYLCGGDGRYLLQRINDTGFNKSLMEFIQENGVVLGVSAGSVIFANNLPDNLGLIDTKLHVHCSEGDVSGKVSFPLNDDMWLTNEGAIVIRDIPDEVEIIGQ